MHGKNFQKDKEQDLESYMVTYLEEEIRQEALVRQIGSFAQFLKLAAAESGRIVNFNKLPQQIGVAQTTITGYYQLLEDCLIAERIEPLTESKVRRRLAAHEGTKPNNDMMGHLFEQFAGLELLRQIRLQPSRMELQFWRDLEGREVDWVIVADTLIPIEVKWTDKPSKKDAKHLYQFLDDYELEHGYIVCQIDYDRKIDERIRALSWRNVNTIFNNA